MKFQRFAQLGLIALLVAGTAGAQSSGFAAFSLPLSPSSVFPPAEDVAAGGQGTVLIHTTRDSAGALTLAIVDFHLDFSTEQAVTIDKLHLHRGPRATKGPVVINANFGPVATLDPGAHQLFRQRVLDDQDSLDAVEDIMADPSAFYVNVHSLDNPDGFIRGQLMRSDAAAISDLQDQIDSLTTANAGLAAELASMKETLARIARRLGVVPAE